MIEVLVPLGVVGCFVLIVGQLTRLLSDISLHRTLREALRSHPDSVAPLAARLGTRQPWSDGLLGWLFVALAIAMVIYSLFEAPDDRREILQSAIIPAVIGIVALAYVHWAKRQPSQ